MGSSSLFKVGGVTVKLMSTLARFLAGLSKNTIRESFLVFTFTFSDVGGLEAWYVAGLRSSKFKIFSHQEEKKSHRLQAAGNLESSVHKVIKTLFLEPIDF